MYYLIGLFIASTAIIASIVHLQQSYSSYFDFVAFAMVLGGTVAVSAIILPWENRRELIRGLKKLIFNVQPNKSDLIRLCLEVITRQKNGLRDLKVDRNRLEQRILYDGLELISLGMSVNKIETILKERIYQAGVGGRKVSGAFRALAKYPPAFGLAGTVLGLVHLMRGVSEGMSAQETGIRMAIALVATLYGLLIANLVVNPAGELMHKNSLEDQKLAEISLQAVLLAAENTPTLEAQEMLNSFVEEAERVDVTGMMMRGDEMGEAA